VTKPKTAAAEAVAKNDTFVPDRQVRAELNISPMTQWRWDRDPAMTELGWPPLIRTGPQGRKYRSRRQLEQFKANLVKRAIAQRGGQADGRRAERTTTAE
jgi:hypothetical protein